MKFCIGIFTLGILPASVNGVANASGFRIPEVSVAGIGASGALVADSDEAGALPYNPALMTFLEGSAWVIGSTVFITDYNVVPDGGERTDSLSDISQPVPNLSYARRINERLAVGVNLNSPFGLESEWPDNTFPGFGGIDAVEPALTSLEMININPNVAYKLGEFTSIALGLNYYDILDANFNTQGIKVGGDGSSYGWNIAMMNIYGPITVGLSYRSSVDAEINGSFSMPAVFSIPVSTTIEFPSMLQLGVRFKVNSKWAIEFDFDRENWESFDRLTIQNSITDTIISVSNFNWKNTDTYRLNVNYVVSDIALFRLGGGFAESPVSGSALFSVGTPTEERKFLSFGLKFDFDKWSFDLGYLYVVADDVNFNSSVTYTGGDANGTSAYNGLYQFDAQEFGVGIQTKF